MSQLATTQVTSGAFARTSHDFPAEGDIVEVYSQWWGGPRMAIVTRDQQSGYVEVTIFTQLEDRKDGWASDAARFGTDRFCVPFQNVPVLGPDDPRPEGRAFIVWEGKGASVSPAIVAALESRVNTIEGELAPILGAVTELARQLGVDLPGLDPVLLDEPGEESEEQPEPPPKAKAKEPAKKVPVKK